ncbi:MAG: hypothetical protein MRZ75_12625, partial [Roseburia sp.]|nr:hypothetical protein [Roseburia sp.]
SDAMIEYFKEHVYGKGEYEDPLGCHMGALYDKWLRETYGQTRLEKAASYLTSLEGLQLMLDAVGIFFEPADMVNALIYLCRKDPLSAGLSALSVLPGLGDLLGKGGKYARSAADALFIRAGKAPGGELLLKAGKGWRQVKLQLSLSYQVAARNVELLLKALDDVLGQMGKEFSGMLRKVAGQEDVYEAVLPGGGRIRIKLEQMSDVGGAGGKAGKGARNGALKSGKNTTISKTESPALKNSPYNPDVVNQRIKPDYVPNPAHDASSNLYNPKKTPEPSDARDVYNNVVRGGMGEWYGVNGSGEIYQFFYDRTAGAHFAGIISKQDLARKNSSLIELLGISMKGKR